MKMYKSINSATEETGITGISHCCRGILKTAGNYFWSYTLLSEDEINERLNDINNINIGKYDRTNCTFRIVYQNSFDGKIFNKKYRSVIFASTENCINKNSIIACCRGRHKSCNNCFWSYYPLSEEKINEQLNNIRSKKKIENDICQLV